MRDGLVVAVALVSLVAPPVAVVVAEKEGARGRIGRLGVDHGLHTIGGGALLLLLLLLLERVVVGGKAGSMGAMPGDGPQSGVTAGEFSAEVYMETSPNDLAGEVVVRVVLMVILESRCNDRSTPA